MDEPVMLTRAGFHRYTITGEGATLGYFRLVEDPAGAWVTWAEVEAALTTVKSTSTLQASALMTFVEQVANGAVPAENEDEHMWGAPSVSPALAARARALLHKLVKDTP